MKRICIYVTLGLLGAVSAHAQEINTHKPFVKPLLHPSVQKQRKTMPQKHQIIHINLSGI